MSAPPDGWRSFAAIIADNARAYPDKPYVVAVDQQNTALSYRELGRMTRRIARFLAARNIAANDRVLLLADNTWEGMALYLGVLARGATVCTPNVEMNAAHLAEIVRALQPRLVLCQDDLALDHLRGETAAEWFGFAAFLAALAALPDEALPPVNGRHDHAVIFYTSGTVAKPKGVIYTHETLWCNFDAVAEMIGLRADDRILDFRSHSWISAQEMGLGGPLTRGATVIMARRFSATRYFDWVREHRVNIGVCVPTGINMLLNRPHAARAADMPHLRFMTSSSAPLVVEQWRAFEDLYGVPIAQGYGASECGWIAGAHRDSRRIATVGRPIK
ncbi:MAG TPA: AMP-binding protein, partial [Alphaproteobacteria bacterium]